MSWALIECDVMASSTEYLITLLMSICGESIGYLLLSPALRVYLAARKLVSPKISIPSTLVSRCLQLEPIHLRSFLRYPFAWWLARLIELWHRQPSRPFYTRPAIPTPRFLRRPYLFSYLRTRAPEGPVA